MMSDIGAATTEQILDDLRAVAKAEKLEPDDVKSVLRLRLIEALSVQDRALQLSSVPAAEGKVSVSRGEGRGGEEGSEGVKTHVCRGGGRRACERCSDEQTVEGPLAFSPLFFPILPPSLTPSLHPSFPPPELPQSPLRHRGERDG